MSLDQLSERLRNDRVKRRSVNLATISVKRAERFASQPRFTGRVILDDQQLGYLVDGELRTFEVEPGEHTIRIFWRRAPLILSYKYRPMSSASVSVSPGERVDFTCGIRPEMVALLHRHRWVELARGLVFAIPALLAALAGWLSAPYLREAVAWAILRVPVNDRLIPLCYRIVNPFVCAFWFELLALWILRRSPRYPRDETDEELISRVGSPWYLERLDGVEVDGRRAAQLNDAMDINDRRWPAGTKP